MSLPQLSIEGREALDELLVDVVDTQGLPCLFFAACNGDEILYENQRGYQDWSKRDGEKVDTDTTLNLFSMTKFVTAVAVHQLVDQGLVGLHDPDIVSKYLPELALGTVNIVTGLDEEDTPILAKATRGITLSMLMSHTSGLSYPWQTDRPAYTKWLEQNPKLSLFAKGASTKDYEQPLWFEPGTDWNYSTGLDWAGFFIERFTGTPLETHYQDKIFKPLGMTSTSFYPAPNILSRLVKMCELKDGSFSVMETPLLDKPVKPEDVTVFNGGGGLYGTTRDYLRLLQGVLRSSPSYHGSGTPLLSQTSFKSIFTGVLSSAEGFSSLERMLNQVWYHQPKGGYGPQAVQHSPGLLIYTQGGENGRSAGSGCWDGAIKTIFWIDPVAGIAAECNTQVMSPSNDNVVGLTVRAFEKALYEGLTTVQGQRSMA